MLIESHRHTAKDLDIYKQYIEIDKLTGYSQVKVKQSVSVIKSWCTQNNAVAYTSWGKDSVLMLHLIVQAGVSVPVVWVKFNDRYNPDCDNVRDVFLTKFDIDYHEEIFDYNEVRKGDKHWKIVAKKYTKYRMTGIRNDESNVRMLQYFVNGHSSQHSCRPIALWRSHEVFAYIEQNDLPLCSVYGYLGGGRWSRDRIRTHSIGGTTANGIGRTEWEKEYYPDILRRIGQI